MSEYKIPNAWGVKYHPGIEEHNGWQCPSCDKRPVSADDLITNPVGWYKFIVGFSHEIPYGSIRSGMHRKNEQVKGCFILECPHCFEKYYMHITVAEIRRAKVICPNWPK